MMKLILLNGLLKMRELRHLNHQIMNLMTSEIKENNFKIRTIVWFHSDLTEATSVSRAFSIEDKNWFTK